MIKFRLSILMLLSIFVLGGCWSFSDSTQSSTPVIGGDGPVSSITIEESLAAQSQIKKFSSIKELQEYLIEEGMKTMRWLDKNLK